MPIVGVNLNDTDAAYTEIVRVCRDLMLKKNHDYGESWREMRGTSITDLIMAKARRAIQLETMAEMNESPQVDESLVDQFRDILNYAAFRLIKLAEEGVDVLDITK
jgi:hypothetical protein